MFKKNVHFFFLSFFLFFFLLFFVFVLFFVCFVLFVCLFFVHIEEKRQRHSESDVCIYLDFDLFIINP